MEETEFVLTPPEDRAAIGKRTVHTQLLVQALRNVPEGEVFTYAQAEGITNLSKAKLMSYLYSAIDIALKDYGINFECDRTVGYRHVPHEAVPQLANKKHIRKLRNTSTRYREQLESVDPLSISQEARTQHTLGVTSLALLDMVVTAKAQRELKKQTANVVDPMKGIDKNELLKSLSGIWK
jgi:hypothetical protein